MKKTVSRLFYATMLSLALYGCGSSSDPSEGSSSNVREPSPRGERDTTYPRQNNERAKTTIRPFLTLQGASQSSLDVYEITSPKDPNIKCVVVTNGDIDFAAREGIASFPVGIPNNTTYTSPARPYETLNNGRTRSVVDLYSITPPSNKDVECIVATAGDVRFDANLSVDCHSLNSPQP